jgi:hypothetical protein
MLTIHIKDITGYKKLTKQNNMHRVPSSGGARGGPIQ